VVAIKSAAEARTGYRGCTVHSGDSWNSQHNTVRKATTPHGPSRPLPIGVGLYVAGLVVTPWFDRESWAYIPRSRALVLDLPSLGAFATAVYLAGQHIGDFSLLWHLRNVALGLPIGAAFVFFGWIDTTRARRSMPTLHRRPRLLRS